MYKETTMDYVKELVIKNEGSLIKIVLSNPIDKKIECFKITAEHKIGKNGMFFHITYYVGNKVTHENVSTAELLIERLVSSSLYKQWDMIFADKNVKIFVNKNNTIKMREFNEQKQYTDSHQPSVAKNHNNERNYMIRPEADSEWLIKLGIMNRSGKILNEKQKKFRQINKFLETASDILKLLPNNAVIVDIGCGKSYLTFALYHYLTNELGKQVNIIGIDIKPDVLCYCESLAKELNFSGMSFYNSAIENFELKSGSADLVVSLHACDTATDYALYNAVRWNSRHIIAVPCCQHELREQVKNESLHPMLKHGVLKERFAAMLTDTIRALALETSSYKCSVMEFVDIEHSTKNLMLKCEKRTYKKSPSELQQLCKEFGVTPKICTLLGLL